MKTYKKVFLIILLCIAFYLLGNWLPVKLLTPSIEATKLKTAEYLQIAISLLSVLVTLGAIITALFKEDLRKYWAFPKLKISVLDENFFEDTNSSSSNEVKAIEAVKYYCKLEAFNLGNIAALDLEIYLESLLYKGVDYPTPQIIATDKYIDWGEYGVKINLSPKGKRTIDIIELSGPTQQSLPTGENTDIPAKLTIANVEIAPKFNNGKWTAAFLIFSTNAKSIRFEIDIVWNGKWEKKGN